MTRRVMLTLVKPMSHYAYVLLRNFCAIVLRNNCMQLLLPDYATFLRNYK